MSRDLSHVKAVGCFCPWPPWDASSVSSQSEPPWPRAAALELEAELWTQVSMNLKTLRDARHTHSLRDGEAAQIPWPGGGGPLACLRPSFRALLPALGHSPAPPSLAVTQLGCSSPTMR